MRNGNSHSLDVPPVQIRKVRSVQLIEGVYLAIFGERCIEVIGEP